MRLP
ncbi:hypothetical protein YPPY72_2415, partial [Yersinia pestis PY-72]|jgi:hypothetical protein